MSALATDQSTEPQSGIRENQTLIEYMASQPLQEVLSLLTAAQITPQQVAQHLEGEGVLPVEHDGRTVDLTSWFNENADKLSDIYSAVYDLAVAADGMNEFDKGIVDTVVKNQTRSEAFYGMATMYGLTDAFRAVGKADMDRSQTKAPSVAFRLQALYDVMPKDMQAQTRSFLAKKYTM